MKKKKICPKSTDPPSAMLDSHGNILTTDKAIEERALEVYMDRLNKNKMKPHLTHEENMVINYVIVINDTALKGTKNREKNKGGMATIVANYLKPITVKVTEGKGR